MGATCAAANVLLPGRQQWSGRSRSFDSEQWTPLARSHSAHRSSHGPALMTGNLVVCADHAALNVKAAEIFRDVAKKALFGSGTCTVSLSGGSTPKSLYALLATPEWKDQFQWKHIHLFWGDERCVPVTHPDSNFAMVEREMLSKIDIPAQNVHRYPVELNEPGAVAAKYERELKEYFGTNG